MIKGEQIKPLTFAEGNGGSWYSPSAAASDKLYHNGWVETRTADATDYREVFPAFDPEADYYMTVNIPGLDDLPLDIPRKGKQIASPGQQRMVRAKIDQIHLIPTFSKAASPTP